MKKEIEELKKLEGNADLLRSLQAEVRYYLFGLSCTEAKIKVLIKYVIDRILLY